jgi:outer membrane protein assembly factor BamB
VVAGDRVCFSGPTESLIVEAQTGRIVWRKDLDSQSALLYGQRIGVLGGLGAFPAADRIVLFDLATGSESAKVSVPNGSLMTPSVWNGKVVTVSRSGELLVLDPARQAVERRVQTSAVEPVGCGVSICKDRAYFADHKGLVVCVDLASPRVLWESLLSTQQPAGVFQDLECDGDRVIAFSKNTLYGLATETGAAAFSPIAGVSSPALLREGFLYYGTDRGFLRIARADTGATLNSLDLGSVVSARPQWIADSLVVGTRKGEIILIDTAAVR